MRLKPDAANDTHRSSISDMNVGMRMWTRPVKPDVRIRQRVVDRRRDDGAELGRDAARDLLRDEHVGQERPVRPVLLGRAGGHDHGVVLLQERFDLGVGHLAEKHGRWLHHPSVALAARGSCSTNAAPIFTNAAAARTDAPAHPSKPRRLQGAAHATLD